MLDEALIDLVERASLWRSTQRWSESDPDLHLASETSLVYRAEVLRDIASPGVHVLTGPRRAGKTVATLKRVEELLQAGDVPPEAVVRASLDAFTTSDLQRLLNANEISDQLGISGRGVWILDEVTSVPGFGPLIEAAVKPGGPLAGAAVVLTGSAAGELLPSSIRPAGVTRSWERLLPMSFRQVCTEWGIELPDPVPPEEITRHWDIYSELHQSVGPAVNDAFERYLEHGGYPLAVAAAIGKGSDLANSRAAQLHNDIIDGAAADVGLDAAELRTALRAVADGLCSPLSLARLGQRIGGNRDGADRVLKGLEATHLAWRAYNSDSSRRDLGHVGAASPKLYPVDPIVLRAAGIPNESVRPGLVEAAVGCHLGRAICPQGEPFFARLRYDLVEEAGDNAGEVDFLPTDPDVPAVEVKSGDPGDGAELLLQRHAGGIVATGAHFEAGEPVGFLPAAYLAAMLRLQS